MVSLVQQDDNFCKQEQIYIDKFVDNLSENKKSEMIEKLGNKQLDGLVEELNKLSDDDQFEILNKLIELAAIDNKIDGKEAYLICYLAKTINLDADKIVDYMQEAYSFEPKLLEDEILRMDNEIDDVDDEKSLSGAIEQAIDEGIIEIIGNDNGSCRYGSIFARYSS